MSDPDDDGDAGRKLARIARALDVPVEVFFDGACEGDACRREAEEGELIALFRRLDDPHGRRRCLDWVRALADGTDGG